MPVTLDKIHSGLVKIVILRTPLKDCAKSRKQKIKTGNNEGNNQRAYNQSLKINNQTTGQAGYSVKNYL